MKAILAIFLASVCFSALSTAHAAPLQMPRIIQGEWCYLGNLPGGWNNDGAELKLNNAALYAPCSEHVGGGGCEDVTISRDGYVPGLCQKACRPTSITLTMYGYDVRYQQCGMRQLFNLISKDRLVITWL
jgi:hypothetical protein